MLFLAGIALAVGCVAGLALGGHLRYLGEARLRFLGLLVTGAACELVGTVLLDGDAGLAFLITGYLLLIAFALANLSTVGMVLIGLGLLANVAVITVDGGMPVHGVEAGAVDGARHHGIRSGDRLTALGDVVHVAPLGETVSGGDIVLSLGVAAAIAALMVRPERRTALR